MLTLPTAKAAPGMTLARPVHHPDKPGHVLLKPGCVLDSVAIKRLREMGVRRIGIKYMPTEFLLRYVGGTQAALACEASRVARRVAEEIDRLTLGAQTEAAPPHTAAPDATDEDAPSVPQSPGQPLDPSAQQPETPPAAPAPGGPACTGGGGLHADFDCQVYVDSVRALIQRLVADPQAALFMHDIVDARRPVAAHAFNVGLLSLLMGLKLGGYLVAGRSRGSARRATGAGGATSTVNVGVGHVESLGLGALLHDIGMTRLPPDVVERFEATRDETDPAWRKHVLLGFNLVKGKLPATASAAVLHHHQRMDGTGFPARSRGYPPSAPPEALRGDEIHIFSRIIGMADTFDRFRNPPGSFGCTPVGGGGGAAACLAGQGAPTWDPLESTCRHASLSIL